MKQNMTTEIISAASSINDACLKCYGYSNQKTYNKHDKFIIENNVNISHYERKVKYCPNCGNVILKNVNTFCNSSCSTTYNNKKKTQSINTKKRISAALLKRFSKIEKKQREKKKCDRNEIIGDNTIWNGKLIIERERKCVICNNVFIVLKKPSGGYSKTKTCSDECHKQLRVNIGQKTMLTRIEEGRHKGWEKRNIVSYPEQFFINVLNDNKIKFEHNYPVRQDTLGLNNRYNFFLDFHIKDKNIDLEIDGKQHNDRKEHDEKRDKLLSENGFIVYRIKWNNIANERGKEEMKRKIEDFLEFYNNI